MNAKTDIEQYMEGEISLAAFSENSGVFIINRVFNRIIKLDSVTYLLTARHKGELIKSADTVIINALGICGDVNFSCKLTEISNDENKMLFHFLKINHQESDELMVFKINDIGEINV